MLLPLLSAYTSSWVWSTLLYHWLSAYSMLPYLSCSMKTPLLVGQMVDHSKRVGMCHGQHHCYITCRFTGAGKLTLVIFSLFGFIFFDAVYIMAIMNYAIQSELNIYLLHALRIKVERREHKSIDAAIKVSNCSNHVLT